jgi:hypothetical protein
VQADRRHLTAALGIVLALVLVWNLYRAEVEGRPAFTPTTTIPGGAPAPASTQTSPWAPQPSTPATAGP